MTTVNKRVKIPLATVINGIDAGGAMTAVITEGYENIIQSAPDGLGPPIVDREIQFCRGVLTTQDWVHFIELLIGAVGTYVFYEKKSGSTKYIKHTLTAPVIHNARINQTKGGYIVCTANFECRAADETKGFADMHALTDEQDEPSYISAVRGGWRVKTAVYDSINVYHVTAFDFGIAMRLDRACNDGDVGYTCVDAELTGMACDGSLSFQDSEIDGVTSALKAQELLAASAGNLVLTVTQSQGAADKIITIARAIFNSVNRNSDVGVPFTGHTGSFMLNNNPAAPLTLDGANKIIIIADA